ncbi:MAG: hypothetical protein ACOYXT_12210 [Bacteroidota bacterium]
MHAWKTLTILFIFLLAVKINGRGQNPGSANRWKMNTDGSLSWIVDSRLPHEDHIEMSGEKISSIIRYGVKEDGTFAIHRTLVWPMLRSYPNKTRANLLRTFDWDIIKTINVNEKVLSGEKVYEIRLDGLITVKSVFEPGLECSRTMFPSPTLPVYFEEYQLKNKSGKPMLVEVPEYSNTYHTDSAKGIYGSYTFAAKSIGGGSFLLDSGKSISFGAIFYAHKKSDDLSTPDLTSEKQQRKDRVAWWRDNLILETPDELLNRAFSFAKIRSAESIYRTKGGLMHGPGGGTYYAAIWANDQAEYIGPFFPFLGYDIGNDASLNAYKHFARFMNPDYKPIPSSIISEGEGTWHGAGDRGDGAMIAYGAARFALALGNKKTAEELWPLIEWCLEFCRRKINSQGVVASDSDELERRFPAGDANLCTSSLYYDALRSAVYLGRELGKPSSTLATYAKQADDLKVAIEKHFGAPVEGFNTYRYYEGNDVLRAWICIPLTVDIFDRKQATIDALFSPRLWTNDGLATQAGKETFWDRSTLYALRGVFAAGEKEKALTYLQYYSNRRLLGEHVPYPVEAYPEGNQRHLSAESGLYCRIFTEGLFGIRPTGLSSFRTTPHLPEGWNTMSLRKIYAFENVFDLEVSREKNKLRVTVISNGKKVYNKTLPEGTTVEIKL